MDKRKYHPKYSRDKYLKEKKKSSDIWKRRSGCIFHEMDKHIIYENFQDFLNNKPIEIKYRE